VGLGVGVGVGVAHPGGGGFGHGFPDTDGTGTDGSDGVGTGRETLGVGMGDGHWAPGPAAFGGAGRLLPLAGLLGAGPARPVISGTRQFPVGLPFADLVGVVAMVS